LEQTAAKELKQHLDVVTGADFAIAKESGVDNTKPQIVVGNSKRTKELLPELDVAKIPYDGIVIKSVGKNLVLLGHPQRGTLYAVNTLLEDEVGVRWWTATESFIPERKTLTIKPQNVVYAPQLIYRGAEYRETTFWGCDGRFTTRLKQNGDLSYNITPEYGGKHTFLPYFVETFYYLLKPQEYFKDHPEWYALYDGERQQANSQLCLTNDGAREQLTQNLLQVLRKHPETTIVSVSQMDNDKACQCDKCRAVVEEEGNESGPILRFVNRVAEDVEKEFPNVWVETLAYWYSLQPPRHTRPRHNVLVCVATMGHYATPYEVPPYNDHIRSAVEGWSKIAPRLFFWDYTTDFRNHLLPFPNYHVLAPNIRYMLKHNAIGVFEQGDYMSVSGDFAELHNWLLSHLLWNPQSDAEQLTDDFLRGYYGAASAPFVKKYRQLLSDRVTEWNSYLSVYHSSLAWLSPDVCVEAGCLMDKAIGAAPDSIIRNRLQRAELPIRLATLFKYNELKAAGKTVPEDPQKAIDEFIADCRRHGVRHYREYGSVRWSPDVPEILGDLADELREKIFGQVTNRFTESVKVFPEYRFFILEITYNPNITDKTLRAQLKVVNTGTLPIYSYYPLEICLLDPKTREVVWRGVSATADCRRWMPGDKWDSVAKRYTVPPDTAVISVEMPVDAPDSDAYLLAVALTAPETGKPAVRFAMDNYIAGGYTVLGQIGVNRRTPLEERFRWYDIKGIKFDDISTERLTNKQE
jgi:hypothetical protein